MDSIKTKLMKYAPVAGASALAVMSSVPTFAAETSATTYITAEQLSTITDTLTAQAGVVVPAGIGIMAVFIGIKFIPKLVKIFTK